MDANEKIGSEGSAEQPNDDLVAEAEGLIWAMLDDTLDASDIRRLENLLKENEQVRECYVNCVQMHVDLQQHFGEQLEPLTPEKLPPSPVLGSLGDLRPGTDTLPPVPPTAE